MSVANVSRRGFLQGAGVGAGALVLGVQVAPGRLLGREDDAEESFSPNVFVTVGGDGTVTVVAHRSEMGQGIRTGLPAIVADELEADWEKVRVVQADGDGKYGSQNTDGSRSVRRFFRPMREAGAAARQMLVAAAAGVWEVEPAECEAEAHRVHHRASGRSLGYGELAPLAARLPVPATEELELKPREAFRYIGRSLPIVDLDPIVTGAAVYGADIRLPGMLVATIEHCPVVGGAVESFEAKEALAVPGVRKVVPLETDGGLGGGFQPIPGVAVVADHTWAALEGRRRLAVTWRRGPHGGYDTEEFCRHLETTAKQPARVVRESGDVAAAAAGAAKLIEATYHVPHLHQAPMEPPAALAHVAEGRCEIWAPTQSPQTVKGVVAEALGIEPDAVTVHVTLLGGAFGRKSKPDFIVEAALLAREVGAPVRVQWTREDDVRTGYYHAVSCQHLRGALDAEGHVTSWHHRSVFPTISATFNGTAKQASTGELSLGLVDLPYAVPNLCLENGEAEAHVRIGWMRSVSNIHHAFAIGSFTDELSAAAGRDPKAQLLELIGPPRKVDLAAAGVDYANYGEPLERFPIDTGRLRKVVERVAAEAGWGKRRPARRALGIAAHRSFLTYVAAVVDAEVDTAGTIQVHEVHAAVDCGTVVNPDRVVAQIEGGIVYGLTLALHGQITAREGAIVESNFHDYPLLRIGECPRRIAVHLVDSDDLPAGVGEPSVPPVAPALTNAIFAATGKRLRELPLRQHDLA